MPDKLDFTERALAWKAIWNPSFVGMGIIDRDYTFRSVNSQFCEILGVSPAELIGKKFTDLTPQPMRDLDVLNAGLIREGSSPSYLLPSCYELSNGRRVYFLLLMVGVCDVNQDFLFYVARIIKNETVAITSTPASPQSSFQKSGTFLKTVKENWHIITAILGSLSLLLSFLIKDLKLMELGK